MILPEIVLKRYKFLLSYRDNLWKAFDDPKFKSKWFSKRPTEHQWSIDEHLRHMIASEIRYIQQPIDETIKQHPSGVPAQWAGNIFFRFEEKEHMSIEEIKKIFTKIQEKSKELLEKLTEEDYAKIVKAPWGQELSYYDLLETYFTHEYSHRGQIRFLITYYMGPPTFQPKEEGVTYG